MTAHKVLRAEASLVPRWRGVTDRTVHTSRSSVAETRQAPHAQLTIRVVTRPSRNDAMTDREAAWYVVLPDTKEPAFGPVLCSESGGDDRIRTGE